MWERIVDMEAEHVTVGEIESERLVAKGLVAEELLIVLPAMPQEHLGQGQNSMKAAEREAEELLRVLEKVLLLGDFGL